MDFKKCPFKDLYCDLDTCKFAVETTDGEKECFFYLICEQMSVVFERVEDMIENPKDYLGR